MRSPFRHTTPLLVAAAGMLIGTAPTAIADSAGGDCTTLRGTNNIVCGDNSINDSPKIGQQNNYVQGGATQHSPPGRAGSNH
jgi:hypothetical protein